MVELINIIGDIRTVSRLYLKKPLFSFQSELWARGWKPTEVQGVPGGSGWERRESSG